MPEKKENKRNVTQAEVQEDGSIKLTSYNTPLVKNASMQQKSAIRPVNIAGKQQNPHLIVFAKTNKKNFLMLQ